MSEIDVSKCELFYNDNRCFGSQKQGIGNDCHKSDYCKYNHNCYYKQLQQLKATLDEIEEILLSNYITSYDIAKMLEKIKEVKEKDE